MQSNKQQTTPQRNRQIGQPIITKQVINLQTQKRKLTGIEHQFEKPESICYQIIGNQ